MQRHFGEVPDETVVFDREVVSQESVDVAELTNANNGRLPPIDDLPINECFGSDSENDDEGYNPRNYTIN